MEDEAAAGCGCGDDINDFRFSPSAESGSLEDISDMGNLQL